MRFIRTTVIGGLLFLIPFLILLFFVGKGLQLTGKIATPLATALGIEGIAGFAAVEVLSILLLVLICFVAGLAAKLPWLRRVAHVLEDRVLEKIPTYQLMKTKAQSALEFENNEELKPVKVRYDDATQLGFEMARTEDGEVVVFLPGSPDPWSGAVCVMAPDRISPLGLSVKDTVKLMKRLGKGGFAVAQEIMPR